MGATLGSINKTFVSAIDYLDQRDILRNALNITNEEASFVELMDLMGKSMPTKTDKFDVFKNVELFDNITSAGTSQGASADIQTVTLSATDITKVRIGDLVLLSDKQSALVTAKNAGGPTITLKHVNGQSIAAACASGQKMVPYSSAYGEGSSGPSEYRRYDLTKDQNIVQIFKNKFRITDVELGNQIEVEFGGKPYFMAKQQYDQFTRFEAEVGLGLLVGQKSANNFSATSPGLTDANSNPVQTTRSLNEYIVNDGISLTGQTIGLATYRSLARKFAAERTPKEFMVLHGIEHRIQHDEAFAALPSGSTFSENARLQVNGTDLKLGITALNLFGYIFKFKHLPVLDHKIIMNFTGSAGFEKRAYYIPEGQIQASVGGQAVDRIMIRYMQMMDGHYDYRYKETHTGGYVPRSLGGPTSDESAWYITYECMKGLMVNGAEHFAYVDLS